jgi:hypothetical protein
VRRGKGGGEGAAFLWRGVCVYAFVCICLFVTSTGCIYIRHQRIASVRTVEGPPF